MDFNFQYCQELVKKKDFKTLELYAAEQLKFDRQHSLEKLEFLALSQYFLQKYKNAEILCNEALINSFKKHKFVLMKSHKKDHY